MLLDWPGIPTHEYASNSIESNGEEQFRSVSEILENLDKEKLKTKKPVQKLIEKFDDTAEVTLRVPEKPFFIVPRHSDDLNKLLEELAKVTSAPIMPPRVTHSLLNPNLADAEVNTYICINDLHLHYF